MKVVKFANIFFIVGIVFSISLLIKSVLLKSLEMPLLQIAIYLGLPVAAVIFFLFCLKLNNELKVNIFLVLFSSAMVLYSVEVFLTHASR